MASVPYEYECDKSSGFLPDPNQHKRVGYITTLNGFNLSAPLAKDLKVYVPFNRTPTFTGMQCTSGPGGTMATAQVVGVIEKFSWNGAVGGALNLDFYASQQNAFQIKSQQQTTLSSTRVNALAWWIIDYDQETKLWYEQSYPLSNATVTGIIQNKDNPALNVDLNGVPAKDGIDVMVYKVSIKVAPGANLSYTLRFANASSKSTAKSWGLVVGTLAATNF